MNVLHIDVSEDIIVIWGLYEYPSERSSWLSRDKVFPTRDISWIFKRILEWPQSMRHKNDLR